MQSFFKNLAAALPVPQPATADLKGKTAIVVGGARGAGYEAVRHFAKLGARVIMLNHTNDESTAAISKIRAQPGQSDAKIEAIVCDLGSLKHVQQECEAQVKKLDRLDLLVICADHKAETFSLTQEGIDTHFAVGALTPLVIAKTLLPLLVKTSKMPGVTKGSVRLVFESSEMHHFVPGSPTAFDRNASGVHFGSTYEINEYGKKLNAIETYGRAKLAVLHYVKMIKQEVLVPANIDVTIAAFHAGTTTTDLEEQWQNPFLGNLLKGVHNIFVKDPAQGAYSCFYAALHKEVVEKGWSGAYFTDAAVKNGESIQAKDEPLMHACWELSHRMIESVSGEGSIGKWQ